MCIRDRPKYTYKKEINRKVAEAGCRTRKDSVMMVETLITASPEFMNPVSYTHLDVSKRQGKTTLTESLWYTSGAIAELGSVDEGTTRTDTMNLERQRGITIQTAVTSFQWEDVKVNIIAVSYTHLCNLKARCISSCRRQRKRRS